MLCRTPPGVRELKRRGGRGGRSRQGRTPPGVRELKLRVPREGVEDTAVAPLPGCVN